MTNEALDQFLEPGTRLTSGDRERIEELCNELYDFAFETCDNEMEIDADEAGAIATNVQNAFLKDMVRHYAVSTSERPPSCRRSGGNLGENKMRIVTAVATGKEQATRVIDELVERSQWFEFEPLPCDRYSFRVKEENAHILGVLKTAGHDQI